LVAVSFAVGLAGRVFAGDGTPTSTVIFLLPVVAGDDRAPATIALAVDDTAALGFVGLAVGVVAEAAATFMTARRLGDCGVTTVAAAAATSAVLAGSGARLGRI
jgi:hypothetical protein